MSVVDIIVSEKMSVVDKFVRSLWTDTVSHQEKIVKTHNF